jgi:enamine deaminase RidA (YjgF/YER057c/UK114 family)
MFKYIPVGLAILSCVAATPARAAAPAARFFTTGDASKPFSAAVRIGNMVFVSGVIGVGPDGTLPADFTAQATNVMQGISDELKLADASMDDVFKCDVALADMKTYAAFNSVYVKYFKAGHFPVRMASGANGLAKGAAVEASCQAYTRK